MISAAPRRLAGPAAERPLRLLVWAALILPALIFAGAAGLSYHRHFDEAQERLARTVDIVYEHAAKVFETLDLVAGRVDQLLAGLTDDEIRAREAEFHARTRALAARFAQVQFVLAIDREGHPLVFSAVFPVVRDIDYSGRDYFQALRNAPSAPGQMFVSAVLQGRLQTSNTTFLTATRRNVALSEGSGAARTPELFDGVIAVSTKPAYFAEYYRQIARGDVDTVSMVRADGALLARYPGSVDADTPTLGPTSAFGTSTALEPERGAYETKSVYDGVRRLYAYRRLPDHPVYVTAGIDRATVLAGWRASLASHLAFGLPATACLVLLAATALTRTRREGAAVAELAERTRELDRVWRTSRDLFVVGEIDGVCRSANPAWREVLGYAPEDILGRRFDALVHPEDIRTTAAQFARLARGEVVRDLDVRLRARDGSERWYSWTCVPEREVFSGSGRDITDRRLLADQLRQAQKMEAVGQLTGGLAHDFNNLLAGISGALELMTTRLAQGRATDVQRYVGVALDATRRAAALTHRLLAFSRRQTLDPRPTDVNALVAGMEDLVRRTVGPTIRVDVAGAPGLWTALVDGPQLESALLNLCINARDAMPEGGRITIETANLWIDAETAHRREIAPGPYLSLSVSDTGTGMAADVVAKAFDPFFTTKPLGAGTGLGLSMVYGFAQQSGGQARILSEPGRGTSVHVDLPRHQGAASPADAPGAPTVPHRAEPGTTVLVVDDEPALRMLVADLLDDLGYLTLDAADGAAGLAILRSDARVDLLVTDVGLPGGMNGRQMADAARGGRPGLRVLFITGYAETAILGSGQLDPGMSVLTKPFAIDALASRIRDMIST